MRKSRRQFVKLTGKSIAGTLLLPFLSCKSKRMNSSSVALAPKRLDSFGIQLWTLKDVFPKDPKGTLKVLAEYGYKEIESFEGDQGMFWGMDASDFKSYLDDLGLKMSASHCSIGDDFEAKIDQAASIGMKYLVCPWVGPQKSTDDWKRVAERFNECGAICKKRGIKFAYHNHDYTFRAFAGMIPHDFLMENTNPELVFYEMDLYWVVTGGADPIDFLKKYSNRFKLCHIKDRSKNAAAEEKNASCDLGTGSIDFSKILKVAVDNGMEHFFMEQERFENTSPMESAKAGAAYLKKLKFT
ncbi:MAG: sugar phosphate isomerase/epimerase family protein [Saprospiraceae bacterium]